MKTAKLTLKDLNVLCTTVSELSIQLQKERHDYVDSRDMRAEGEHVFSIEEMGRIDAYEDQIAYLKGLWYRLHRARVNK